MAIKRISASYVYTLESVEPLKNGFVEYDEDNGTIINELISDKLTLKNPFDYGEEAICIDFQINSADYKKLKQFCFAKGIYGRSIDFLLDNPYIKGE